MDDLDGLWVEQEDDGSYAELLIDSTGEGRGDGWFEHGRGKQVYEIHDFAWRRRAPNRIDVTFEETREIEDDGSVTRGWDPEPSSHTVELRREGRSDDPRPDVVLFTPSFLGRSRMVRRNPSHRPRP